MRAPHRGALRAPLTILLALVASCAYGGDAPSSHGGSTPSVTPDPTVDPPDPVETSDAGPATSPTLTSCPADAAARFAMVMTEAGSLLEAAGVPGGVLTVVCAGRPALVAGLGTRRQGSTDAVTADTRFQWASMTKMFTAATALSLAGDGMVSLDAPLADYLPRTHWSGLTLGHLLTHTGGFPTEFAQNSADLTTVVDRNASMQLWAEPGAVWNYSNPGYAVAGRALEVAAGDAYAQLVRSRVLDPLGMTATMDVAEVESGEFAYGHTRDAGYSGPIGPRDSYFDTTYYQPMGGLWGSGNDFARWAEAHMGDDASLRAMHEPRAQTTGADTKMGYGMFIETSEPRWVHHGGSAPGFGGDFDVLPDAGFAVAVAVNADWYDPSEIVDAVMTRFEITVDWQEDSWTRGPEAADRYVGVYQAVSELGRVEVTASGGRLYASIAGGARSELSWVWGDSFEVPFGGDQIDLNFWRDSDAASASYVVSLWGVARRQ